MPAAFADVICSCCFKNMKYKTHSHYDDGYLQDFICPHYRCSVLQKNQVGWLFGFDQLAGLYFNTSCKSCGNQKYIKYEAKTFGKVEKNENFTCCGKSLNFHFNWAH